MAAVESSDLTDWPQNFQFSGSCSLWTYESVSHEEFQLSFTSPAIVALLSTIFEIGVFLFITHTTQHVYSF